MALTLHTNYGFVTSAPVDDPAGTVGAIDNRSRDVKDTAPVGATTITEVGWWCDTASEEANFEVGLYDSDGIVVPGEAGTLLEVSRTNAKGTTAGWKVVTGLNWSITAGHDYWLAVQVDNTLTTTNTDTVSTGGVGADVNTAATTTLPDDFGSGAFVNTNGLALYAVYTSGSSSHSSSSKSSSHSSSSKSSSHSSSSKSSSHSSSSSRSSSHSSSSSRSSSHSSSSSRSSSHSSSSRSSSHSSSSSRSSSHSSSSSRSSSHSSSSRSSSHSSSSSRSSSHSSSSSGAATQATGVFLTDAATPPTVETARMGKDLAGAGDTITVTITAFVLPGHYYQLREGAPTLTIVRWVEYLITLA